MYTNCATPRVHVHATRFVVSVHHDRNPIAPADSTLDKEEFLALLGPSAGDFGAAQLEDEFRELCGEASPSLRGTEQIDFDTFMGWWKRKAMASQRFAEKFEKIGLREGAARIRTPDVRATAETQNTHTQRFFSSKLLWL